MFQIFSFKSNKIYSFLGFVKRPVIHLYMIAWGIPLALCSIIISITRQDYIHSPYFYCFTNDSNVLISSLLVPLVSIFLAQFFIVVITLRSLRKIIIHLKQDELINEDGEEYDTKNQNLVDKVDDREEFCQNWINSKGKLR